MRFDLTETDSITGPQRDYIENLLDHVWEKLQERPYELEEVETFSKQKASETIDELRGLLGRPD